MSITDWYFGLCEKIAWKFLPPENKRGFGRLLEQIAIIQEDVQRFQRDTDDTSMDSLKRYFEMRTDAAGSHTGMLTESKDLKEASLSEELDEPGWRRLAPIYYAGIEDLPYVRQDAVRASRYYSLRDPLLHRAVWLVIRYVWGRGIIGPKADDEEVQDFLDTITGDDDNDLLYKVVGQWELSQVLIEDGEIFLTMFVNTTTGGTKFSYVLTDEIDDVISAPNNRRKPAYYKRLWAPQVWNWKSHSYSMPGVTTDYWPDWSAPITKLEDPPNLYECEYCGAPLELLECDYCKTKYTLQEAGELRTIPITGVEHATVGTLFTRMFMHQYKVNTRNRRGMPAFYAAIPYTKAYKGFIEDRAVLLIALATFAFKQNISGNTSQVNRMVTQWGNTIFSRYGSEPSRRADRERTPGGRVLVQNDAAPVEQMSVDTGANNAYQDGRIMRQQVAAAVDLTEPDLTGDPSPGNLASMTAMNGPQLKGFEWWQQIFENIVEDATNFVLRMGVKYGPLTEENNLSFEVDFPPIVQKDLPSYIGAVAQLISAQSLTGQTYIAPERVARYILQVFGEKDIDLAMSEIDFSNPMTGLDSIMPAEGFPDGAADQLKAMESLLREALTR